MSKRDEGCEPEPVVYACGVCGGAFTEGGGTVTMDVPGFVSFVCAACR